MLLLKKTAASFFLPPGIFVLAAACMAFRAKGRLRALLLVFASAVYLLSVPILSGRLASLCGPDAAASFSSCDVIIVLGGGVIEGSSDLSGSGSLPAESAMRTCDAARMWRKTGSPVIVCGGPVMGLPAEAFVMKRYLCDLGVLPDRIITEDRSRDTGENARYAAEIMKRKGFSRPLVVTSYWHCRRAEREFSKFGFSVSVYPSGMPGPHTLSFRSFLPAAAALRESSVSLKELAALAFP